MVQSEASVDRVRIHDGRSKVLLGLSNDPVAIWQRIVRIVGIVIVEKRILRIH